MSLIAQILQKYKAPAGCSNMAGILSAFLMTNTNMDWIINTGTSDHMTFRKDWLFYLVTNSKS